MNSTEGAGLKEYEFAVKQGYKGSLFDWKTEIAKSGATRISLGEKIAEMKEKGKVAPQVDAMSPTGLSKRVNDFIDSKEGRLAIDRLTKWSDKKGKEGEAENAINLSKARAKAIIDRYDGEIVGMGGSILSKVLDNDKRTVVWKVRWPSGDVSEVRRDITK
jgi:hypothetical protein